MENDSHGEGETETKDDTEAPGEPRRTVATLCRERDQAIHMKKVTNQVMKKVKDQLIHIEEVSAGELN